MKKKKKITLKVISKVSTKFQFLSKFPDHFLQAHTKNMSETFQSHKIKVKLRILITYKNNQVYQVFQQENNGYYLLTKNPLSNFWTLQKNKIIKIQLYLQSIQLDQKEQEEEVITIMITCFHQSQEKSEQAQRAVEVAALRKIKEVNKKVDFKEQDYKF